MCYFCLRIFFKNFFPGVAAFCLIFFVGLQKKKHRQLRTVLCGRCRLLSHGHMITAVGGNGGYSGGKAFISADELREKLSHLRHEKALIIKLVLDLLREYFEDN